MNALNLIDVTSMFFENVAPETEKAEDIITQLHDSKEFLFSKGYDDEAFDALRQANDVRKNFVSNETGI